MKKITIYTEYIKLGQLLKLIGEISNGSDAKMYLESYPVLVNDELENRRGRKLYAKDIININKIEYIIENDQNK